MHILGLSGCVNSGKDTVALHLLKYPYVYHLKCADPLQDLTAYLIGLSDDKEAYKKLFQNHSWKDGQYYEINGKLYTPRQIQKILGKILRAEFGQDLFAWWLSNEINKLPNQAFVIVSDIRRPPELAEIKKFSNGYTAYIHNDKAWEEFQNNPEHENETEAYHLLLEGNADFHIYNNGSLSDLYVQLDEIYQKIRFPMD